MRDDSTQANRNAKPMQKMTFRPGLTQTDFSTNSKKQDHLYYQVPVKLSFIGPPHNLSIHHHFKPIDGMVLMTNETPHT